MHSAFKSAPQYPTHFSARCSRSRAGGFCSQFRVWISRISARALASGNANASSRSKRPGRLSAPSMASTRLVAPSTTTRPRASRPSISASSVATMELWIWSVLDERTGAKPSISSKKMMEGSRLCASANSSRSCRSLSPTHLLSTSAPLRMKKETSAPARLQEAASARAMSVLPVPGAPYRSTPRGGDILNREKTSGYSRGRNTISFSECT